MQDFTGDQISWNGDNMLPSWDPQAVSFARAYGSEGYAPVGSDAYTSANSAGAYVHAPSRKSAVTPVSLWPAIAAEKFSSTAAAASTDDTQTLMVFMFLIIVFTCVYGLRLLYDIRRSLMRLRKKHGGYASTLSGGSGAYEDDDWY